MVCDKRAQRLRCDERRVAWNDEDVAIEVADGFIAGARGVRGAELSFLLGEREGSFGLGLHGCLNGVRATSNDDDRLRRVQPGNGIENGSRERAAVQVVENLGRRGLEALAFTGREHDRDERAGLLFWHQLARGKR